MACGSPPSISPLRFFQSLGLTPAARTAIRTWPGPGCGSGRSTISRTSGPPNWLKRAAFTIRSDLDSGAAVAARTEVCQPRGRPELSAARSQQIASYLAHVLAGVMDLNYGPLAA